MSQSTQVVPGLPRPLQSNWEQGTSIKPDGCCITGVSLEHMGQIP